MLRAARLVSAVGAVCLCASTALAQSFTVQWKHERLTITAQNAQLADVVREVARQTGSRVEGLEKIAGFVNVDIRNARLLDALRSMLADVDYIMQYSVSPAESVRFKAWLYRLSNPERVQHVCVETPLDGDVHRAASCGDLVSVVAAFDVGEHAVADAAPDSRVSEESRLVAEGHFDINATEGGLLSLTKFSNYNVRIRALQALALQNSPAGHAAMTAALDDPNPFVRAEAMELLLHVGTPKTRASLTADLLEHRDPVVRFSAVAGLIEDRSEGARRQVERALGDEDAGVRTIAADVLRQQASQKSKQQL